VPDYLTIGDFSRATHLTVKTLRHYHQLGLLEPAEVDEQTGYRRYRADQIPVAQVISRFRALDMPLGEIAGILSAPTLLARNERIAAHLSRLEEELGRTQSAITSLRDLLLPPQPGRVPAAIQLRSTPAVKVAAVTGVISAEDSPAWIQGALGELYATLTAQDVAADGPAGGIFADEMFTRHQGSVTIFVPCTGPVRPMGRVGAAVIPAVELAVIEHAGALDDVDRSYGTLGAYVARHAVTVDSPIREYYLVGLHDTAHSERWRTEIGWPIFRTSSAALSSPDPRD
jgi:DNA-binding transcriptional MerR regulator